MELRTCMSNNKRVFLIDGHTVEKSRFLFILRDLIKQNNRLYYKHLKHVSFDYIKHYHEYNGMLLDYKNAKHDMIHNGMIYHFSIELDVK